MGFESLLWQIMVSGNRFQYSWNVQYSCAIRIQIGNVQKMRVFSLRPNFFDNEQLYRFRLIYWSKSNWIKGHMGYIKCWIRWLFIRILLCLSRIFSFPTFIIIDEYSVRSTQIQRVKSNVQNTASMFKSDTQGWKLSLIAVTVGPNDSIMKSIWLKRKN